MEKPENKPIPIIEIVSELKPFRSRYFEVIQDPTDGYSKEEIELGKILTKEFNNEFHEAISEKNSVLEYQTFRGAAISSRFALSFLRRACFSL